MASGRPTKLTPELQKRLCDAIAEGNYYKAACGCAGIHYAVFRRWMQRGAKARRGIFREFRDSVLKAESEAEANAVAKWKAHMPENWQACRDFLARRYPKRWANQESVELKGNKKKPLRVMMSDDDFDRLPLAERVRLLQEEMGSSTEDTDPPATPEGS